MAPRFGKREIPAAANVEARCVLHGLRALGVEKVGGLSLGELSAVPVAREELDAVIRGRLFIARSGEGEAQREPEGGRSCPGHRPHATPTPTPMLPSVGEGRPAGAPARYRSAGSPSIEEATRGEEIDPGNLDRLPTRPVP